MHIDPPRIGSEADLGIIVLIESTLIGISLSLGQSPHLKSNRIAARRRSPSTTS
jgi:hypothetical protein